MACTNYFISAEGHANVASRVGVSRSSSHYLVLCGKKIIKKKRSVVGGAIIVRECNTNYDYNKNNTDFFAIKIIISQKL